MEPLVSVGMSVYNCERTISRTIQSLINQTYSNWEIIVIDDGSTDATVGAVKGFSDSRIRIMSDGKNLGLPVRLNQAVNSANGKYFARMDGDDIAYPERFSKQVDFLEKNSNIDLIGSRVMIFDDSGHAHGCYPFKASHEEICSRYWAGFYLPHPTWMGKIEWFKNNSYNPDMFKTQDQELLLRTYRTSRFASLSDILLGYRKQDFSLKTILTGRAFFSRALFFYAIDTREYLIALRVIEQMIKSLVDIFAIVSGLKYHILRHRAIQVKPEEILKWTAVWNSTKKTEV